MALAAILGSLTSPTFAGPEGPVPPAADWELVYGTDGDAVDALTVAGGSLLAGTRHGGVLLISGTAATSVLASAATAFSSSDGRIRAATRIDGVFESADGGTTWTTAHTPPGIDVYALTASLAGTEAGVFARSGTGWAPRLAAPNVRALLTDGSAAGTEHGVFLSPDGGANWTWSGPRDVPVRAVVRTRTAILAATRLGLARHADGWTTVHIGPVHALATAVANPDVAFAGTGSGVFASTDGFASSRALGDAPEPVFSLAVAGTCPETVYAGSDTGVWRTTHDCGGPAAAGDAAATPQYTPVTIDVVANDTDPDGDTLEVVRAFGAEHGSVEVEPDGRVTYTPDASFKDGDTFTYEVTDGDDTATADVTVDVVGCGEDGPVSGPVDRTVEPAVAPAGVAPDVHRANCDVVVPAEKTLGR